MKTFEFQDQDSNKICVQHSSSVNESYRIYVTDPNRKPRIDKLTKQKVSQTCLHLTRNQAQMLIAGLEDLFADNDNL